MLASSDVEALACAKTKVQRVRRRVPARRYSCRINATTEVPTFESDPEEPDGMTIMSAGRSRPREEPAPKVGTRAKTCPATGLREAASSESSVFGRACRHRRPRYSTSEGCDCKRSRPAP